VNIFCELSTSSLEVGLEGLDAIIMLTVLLHFVF